MIDVSYQSTEIDSQTIEMNSRSIELENIVSTVESKISCDDIKAICNEFISKDEELSTTQLNNSNMTELVINQTGNNETCDITSYSDIESSPNIDENYPNVDENYPNIDKNSMITKNIENFNIFCKNLQESSQMYQVAYTIYFADQPLSIDEIANNTSLSHIQVIKALNSIKSPTRSSTYGILNSHILDEKDIGTGKRKIKWVD